MKTPGIVPLLLFAAVTLRAQYTTGRLEGLVLDPSGASISGSEVNLLSLETSASRSFTTGTGGSYFFAAVPPGHYRVSARKVDFAPTSAEVTVYTSQTSSQNLTLNVGEQPMTLEVQADATPELNSSEALRSVTRNTLDIESLPNLGRNIVSLMSLAPGVQSMFNPRGGALVTLSIAQAGQIAANGGRPKATSHQLDYTDANDWEFGGIALFTQPTPDMLQEFKILTNNWAAEYGVKASAEVLVTTKSGTNALHGTAYDFLQNAALNARDYLDRSGVATALRQNYYGFTGGGPVLRNRTFVFGGFEGRKTRGSGNTAVAILPSQAARDSVTDSSIRRILALLPIPNSPSASPLTGTLTVLPTSPSNSDQFIARVDRYFTQKHLFTARYFQNSGTNFSRTANSLPGFDATFDPKGRNAMLGYTWMLSPRSVNELRISYGRSSALFSPETLPATPRFSVVGLVGFGTVNFWPQGRVFNVYQITDAFSHVWGMHVFKAGFDLRSIQDNSLNDSNRRGVFSFTSVDAFLAGTVSNWTQVFGNTYRGYRTAYDGFFVQDDWRLTRSLTLNLGLRWEIQDGLSEVHHLQSVLDPATSGSIGAAGTGVLGSFQNANPVVKANPFLVAPRFGFAWNPNEGRLVIRGGYGIYYDSFLFNGLQAGRTTPPTNYTATLAGAEINGANSLANLLAGTAQIQHDLNAQIGGFGSLINLGSVTSSMPNLRNPYAQHFSLGVQVRLTSSTVADVSYVATKGTALTTFEPGNSVIRRPAPAASLADEQARLSQFQAALVQQNGPGNTRLDPRFNDVSLIQDNGSSIYHSFQFQVRRSFSRGLQVQASYTWSKSIDNSSDYTPAQATSDRNFAQNQFNLRGERAVSSFDIPHRFTLSHVYQIPFFRQQKGVEGRILGGWIVASINQLQSGIPYTILSGPRLGISDVNGDGNLISSLDNARAGCVPGGIGFTFGSSATIPAPNQRGVSGAPNPSNFKYVQPLLGNDGSCGRNTERMNKLINFDWSFSKQLRLRENGPLNSGAWGLELRADLFNVFNIPFLTATGDDFRTLSSPNFGLYNAAAPSRRIQMALRLTW